MHDPDADPEPHAADSGAESGAGGRLVGLDRAAAAPDAAAVMLLLHGGRAHSYQPVSRGNLAAVRMAVLAGRVRQDRSIPVLALRYRVRGWNDEDGARTPDPVHDALLALALIEARLGPVPVILVGHSLGGRAAVRVAGYPTVRGVAALAPWLPPGEPAEPLAGRTVLIAHGRQDRVTDPEGSIAFATRASAVADAVYLKVLEDGHAMLRSPGAWHRLVAHFAERTAFGPDAATLDAELIGGH